MVELGYSYVALLYTFMLCLDPGTVSGSSVTTSTVYLVDFDDTASSCNICIGSNLNPDFHVETCDDDVVICEVSEEHFENVSDMVYCDNLKIARLRREPCLVRHMFRSRVTET